MDPATRTVLVERKDIPSQSKDLDHNSEAQKMLSDGSTIATQTAMKDVHVNTYSKLIEACIADEEERDHNPENLTSETRGFHPPAFFVLPDGSMFATHHLTVKSVFYTMRTTIYLSFWEIRTHLLLRKVNTETIKSLTQALSDVYPNLVVLPDGQAFDEAMNVVMVKNVTPMLIDVIFSEDCFIGGRAIHILKDKEDHEMITHINRVILQRCSHPND